MDKIVLDNLVAGKPALLSGKRFDAASPFYADYVTQAPNSGLFDVKNIASKASAAAKDCQALSFDERQAILERAARKLDANSPKLLEYVVKMTGMPLHYARKHMRDAANVIAHVPALVRKRLNLKTSSLHHHPVPGEDYYVNYHPLDGFLYSVTPGNDPRATAFVAAWCATLGIPAVIKPSKNDLMGAHATVSAILNAGYPESGLNLIMWDTTAADAQTKNFSLVDAASAVWAFGDDNTVDQRLRLEDKNGTRIDHFTGKTILRHASGRGAGVCDEHADLKKSARIIAESAFEWPVACNSLKALFDASGKNGELAALIAAITRREFAAYAGDPMKESTRVGFVEPRLLKHVNNRLCELKRLSLIKEVLPARTLSEKQALPLLLETSDRHSEFLAEEHSLYVLAMKKCASFKEAVAELNESSGSDKRISVSVFCDNEDKVLSTYLHAHHIKRIRHSTELDVLYHEGNDYLHRLTVPQVHRKRQ